jgi:Ca2+-transporting ATPase
VSVTFSLQLVVIYMPYFNHIFKTSLLSAFELSVCIAVSAIVAAFVEVEKWLARRGLIYQR